MSAISGVTASVVGQRSSLVTDKFSQVKATLTFGDGALTYPTGGIPVDKSIFGFRNIIRDLFITDPSHADGYIYKYDATNYKILIYVGNYTAMAVGPLVELSNTATPAATTLVVEAEGF